MKIKNNKEDLIKNKKILINIDIVSGFVKYGSLCAQSIIRIVNKQFF